MSDDPFGKWWPCLKKHEKRLTAWLPHVKRVRQGLNGRDLRYFTLCAPPMIDVYLLVREGLVPFDQGTRRVEGVTFCECEESVVSEMKELIGVEEAGFFAKLEDLVLFVDSDETRPLATIQDLSRYLADQGEGLDDTVAKQMQDKRKHLEFQLLFPFDFINLDFCDRYYQEPPNVLRIHETVKKMLEWQSRDSTDDSDKTIHVEKFFAAITCRTDSATPADALTRLKQIVEQNRHNHPEYRTAMNRLDGKSLDQWQTTGELDFFMSAWPKEIARLATELHWDIEIKEHLYYDRINDKGQPYNMVCLVAEFTRAEKCSTYLTAITTALSPESRREIRPFDIDSAPGKALLADLGKIVALRNEQARYYRRVELPDPRTEILRLRAEGVPV
ncbi:MAG: hypothetical protein Q7S40_31620 [Opitutaceae bacterium]|nr:hypothetical protein [Opitutaceae bacterium]